MLRIDNLIFDAWGRRFFDSASVAIQQEGIDLVFEGYRSGKLDLTKLISHRFSLEDAAEAVRLASNPQPDSMKIVLKP